MGFFRQHVWGGAGLLLGPAIAIGSLIMDTWHLIELGLPVGAWIAIGLTIFFMSIIGILTSQHNSITSALAQQSANGPRTDHLHTTQPLRTVRVSFNGLIAVIAIVIAVSAMSAVGLLYLSGKGRRISSWQRENFQTNSLIALADVPDHAIKIMLSSEAGCTDCADYAASLADTLNLSPKIEATVLGVVMGPSTRKTGVNILVPSSNVGGVNGLLLALRSARVEFDKVTGPALDRMPGGMTVGIDVVSPRH